VSRGVRPLDGSFDNTPGLSFCFGLLLTPDGQQRVCEATGGSVGPHSAFRYTFTDCLSGRRVVLEGDGDTPIVGEWRPIMSRERLARLTGLAPLTLRDGSILWQGGWWTKERRNPIMLGLYRFCMEHPVACTHNELRAILLNQDPRDDVTCPRFNNTRDFAERVADTVDSGRLALADAIRYHYEHDLAMTRRSYPDAVEVNLARLADAAGYPVLLGCAQHLVDCAAEEIEHEITQAKLDAVGGALQESLFAAAPVAPAARAAQPNRVTPSAPPAEPETPSLF
jgi:hypothetical protein